MANAHLPNSHPEVTPGYRPFSYPLTPFPQAVSTKLVDGTDNCFAGFAPRDWCNVGDLGFVAHGGFSGAVIISTSRIYSASKHAAKNQPDVVHMHVQYLAPLPHGNFKVEILDLKLGSKHSVIQVMLKASNSPKPSIIALVTLGNLAAKGHSIEPQAVGLPDREKDCVRWIDARFFNLSPTSSKMRSYVPKGGPTPLWSPSLGQNRRDMWVKVDDDKDSFDFSHLGFIVDMVPDIPLNYEKKGLAGIMKWAFVTICLSLDIRRDPRGEEWLLQRTVMNECKDGRFDMEVKLYTEKGDLVASSAHSCLMIARSGQVREKDLRKGAVL